MSGIKDIGTVVAEGMSVFGLYSNSLRAIPDSNDGLKPVARYILYAMHGLGLKPSGNGTKSAEIVGTTTGKYHPHGDAAVYLTLVGMSKERYPLVLGEGNFGNANCGTLYDPPAAARYTECKLSPLGWLTFDEIDVASMIPTYKGTDERAPLNLPTRLPLLLMNGTEGVGVGVGTHVPPHNLRELVTLLLHTLKMGVSDRLAVGLSPRKHLARLIRKGVFLGPDYGAGMLVSSPSTVADVYARGHGTLKFRCKYHFEATADGGQLIVTDYCPRFNPKEFIESCSELAEEGLITLAEDKSESRNGVVTTRLVVEFNDAGPVIDKVLPLLTKPVPYNFNTVRVKPENGTTRLNPTYKVRKNSSLFDLCFQFIDFRRAVETRVLNRDLSLAERSDRSWKPFEPA